MCADDEARLMALPIWSDVRAECPRCFAIDPRADGPLLTRTARPGHGLVAVGAMWLRMARVAQDKLAAGAEPDREAFYRSKLVTAKFWLTKVVPQVQSFLDWVKPLDDNQMIKGDRMSKQMLAEQQRLAEQLRALQGLLEEQRHLEGQKAMATFQEQPPSPPGASLGAVAL
jgi:hypothetical protein